jgi:hypothetical protein
MRKTLFIKHLGKIVPVCCMLFTCIHTYAQVATNDCLDYYYQKGDSTSPKFRSATETEYAADDSTLKGKKFRSEKLVVFDKAGQEILVRNTDTIGVVDSERNVYDANFHELRDSKYERNDSGKMEKTEEEIWAYDKHNNVIKDSIYKLRRYGSYRYYRMNTKMKPNENIDVTYSKYDTAGNEIELMRIEYGDTTITNYKYDNKNREIYRYERELGRDWWRKYYTNYDAKGRAFNEINLGKRDTDVINKKYDDKGRMILKTDYDNGRLYEIVTHQFDKDGTETDTETKTPFSDGTSCPDNSSTVYVYDKDGNELSYITTKLKDGRPYVETNNYKYTFSNGHKIIDSTMRTAKGYLYSSSSIEVTTRRYDAHGNELEEAEEGGGEYAGNKREVWTYNENNKLLIDANYNSCNADKPETYTKYIYYPGGKKIKEIIWDKGRSNGIETTFYSEDSRELENRTKYEHSSYQTIYKYEK